MMIVIKLLRKLIELNLDVWMLDTLHIQQLKNCTTYAPIGIFMV